MSSEKDGYASNGLPPVRPRPKPPVILLAHSLGGVACVELMASPDAPSEVRGLITLGSQVPLIHEFGALSSLKEGLDLPLSFPRWLNFYDRNDFLSYVAGRVFSRVRDVEVKSGLSFPKSHGGYFGCDDTWLEIKSFLEDA
jgi:pimeloyl-ACP methyl ester carboxylesterase